MVPITLTLIGIGLIGMAVTADQYIKKDKTEHRVAGRIAASKTIYAGTLAFIASGYVTDVINSGANPFFGVPVDKYDNANGANGDITGEFRSKGQFVFAGQSGFAQSDVQKKVYASDNYTLTTTSSSNSYVGTIVEFISATEIKVEIDCQAA